jgi:putative ABC transport system permease protein
MRWLAQLRMRMLMLFGRGNARARLDEELRDHLERQIEENIAAGMTAEEARLAALREFGNPALLREQARGTWNWIWLEGMLRDVRYGMRTLGRTPGFAAIAILVMALGIGANVTMFTIVRSVLLKPLPFAEPNQLVMVYERGVVDEADSQFNVVTGGMFTEWKRQNKTFQDIGLAGAGGSEFNLSGAGGQLPEKLHGVICTWNLLPLLGVKPALGRGFTADDDQLSANGTVLLTWGLWKRRFGGDPAIINQSVHINTRSYIVIGVLPAWFVYPEDPAVQLLTPVYHDKPADRMNSLGNHQFEVIGRLRPGVTAEQATADLALIARRLHDAHLDNPLIGKAAVARPLLEDMVVDARRPLYVLFAATGCVLLIACLNVANLLVARGAVRRKEQAIRMALGGGRLRLLRENLMESLLLAVAGGAGGIALAWAAIEWLAKTRPDLSRVEAVHIDGVVLVFTAGLIVLCALFAGVIGSMVSRDARLLASLQESSRAASAGQGRVRLRKGLLAVEVGLTVVLLVCAGLLLKSYERLRSSDMGCTTHNVLTMRIGLFGGRYNDRAEKVNFFSELLTRVRALPGVEGAGFVQAVPGQGYWGDGPFEIVEHPPQPVGQMQLAIYRWADPGYFAAMGIPILRGRSIDPGKRLDGADESVISKSFADQHLPGEDPIGKHLRVDGHVLTIVGVVGDTRYAPAEDPRPMEYLPLYSGFPNNGTLVIRSSRDVEQQALPVQRIVQSMDRDLPVSDVMTMEQLLGKSTMDASFDATLLAVFAGLSLLLAAVGLFGVLSYIVAQRTSEIGIRIALGARREQVLRKVMLDGLRPALLGLVLGLAASAGAAKEIASMLYGTEALDMSVFAGVSGALLLVAAAACLVPAWRASRLDPMRALRTE